ncbi:MAG: ParB/RepB/Spo0J family partition protein [Tenericutes bacterium]|nr:ParB/RepB/Spo0J family partition protein [Mycoplasmatota bacterium]
MEDNKDKIFYVPIEDILPNRFQPRLAFDEKELNELASSIIKYGVIQPIVIRAMGEKFEIIAGERRYKASVLAGLKKIPAIMMDTDDNTSAEIALLENIQRKNLTVIEEAQSYKKLMDKGFTQEDIAIKLGISQSSVANKMRLLNLPKEVQEALLYNRISERHARSLLSLDNIDLQKSLLNRIVVEKLTVKQTEDEINMMLNKDNIQNADIPEDIMKFLQPEPKIDIQDEKQAEGTVEEFLDIKVPEVVTIDNNPLEEEPKLNIYEEENDIINPFQATTQNIIEENIQQSSEEKEDVKEDALFEKEMDSPTPNTNNFEFTEEEEYEEEVDPDSLLNEFGEVNLPRVINKVRSFVESLDEVSNLISTSELDLTDKYQIIIDIDKSTPM